MEECNKLCFEVKRLGHAIERSIRNDMSRQGFDDMTNMHGWILGYLYRNKDVDVYQKDIEKEFGISKSTVTNIIQLMEDKGYVIRKADKYDSRLKVVKLTRKGTSMHLKTVEIIDTTMDTLEDGITEQERKTFDRICRKIMRNIELQEEYDD